MKNYIVANKERQRISHRGWKLMRFIIPENLWAALSFHPAGQQSAGGEQQLLPCDSPQVTCTHPCLLRICLLTSLAVRDGVQGRKDRDKPLPLAALTSEKVFAAETAWDSWVFWSRVPAQRMPLAAHGSLLILTVRGSAFC